MSTTQEMGSAMPGLEDAIAAAQDDAAPGAGLEIPVPEGFEAPEDAQSGASFDVLATVKMVGGSLTLEAIDGLPVTAQATTEEADEEMEEGEMPDEADFVSAIDRSMAEDQA
jgi:hypothetical protein